jgi:phosphoglycerol transferase
VRAAWTSTSRRALALGAALVAVTAVVLLVPVLELWDADLGVPLATVYSPADGYVYTPDAPFYQMLAKGGLDHLWFLDNDLLGWPLGQQVHDLPQTLDNLNLLGLKVLGVVVGDVGATVNIFFVLTFAAVAASAYLVLRALRVSAPSAFVAALLYAYLPYHFARGVPHLFLSAYWVVPVAVYLVLRVVSDRPPFTAARESPRGFGVRVFDRAGILWLLACIAIASSGAYYGVFAATLVAALAVVDFAANRRVRVLASAGVALAAIGVVAFVNLLPSFVYWAEHGANDALVRRLPYETEAEGLKVSQLLLPIERHRFGPFAETQADSTRFSPVPSEEGQHLGVIGAVGFLAVLVALLLAGRRRRDAVPAAGAGDEAGADGSERAPPSGLLRTLGVLTVVAVFLATVSGFSLLVSGLGFREIRAWNRIVVFIAFFAFIAVAVGLDWLGRRLPDRPWRVPLAAAGLALVLVFGILDQVSPASIPDYDATRARWDSDEEFVGRIERVLERDDDGTPAVFQLPYLYFPEAPQQGALGPYDLVRGYLHSDDLAWSWGAVRGRGADWQLRLLEHPTDDLLDRIAAVGYSGLVLDRRAMGGDPADVEGQLRDALQASPEVSRDRELLFWDLRPRARELRGRLGDEGVAELRRETLADVPKVRAQGS